MLRRGLLGALGVVFLLAACGSSSGVSTTPPDDEPREPAPEPAATPWPIVALPELPESMKNAPEARIELGRMLFYDPVISTDDQTACVTCHSELWGMGDAIPRSVGHGAGLDAGPRRDGPNELRRNSPAIYNLAFRESLLWDGRASSLEERAIMPVVDPGELGSDEQSLIDDLSAIPEYVDLFAEAFPDDPRVTVENFGAAIAAFERTVLSIRSTYDVYVEGRHELLDEEEIEGMFRFAEMGCDGCHVPPLFESDTFANRHAPEIEGITDHGREEHTGLVEDRGKFRTPSLRNLAATEPYFHNGSVKLMSEAVRHELDQSGIPFTEEDVDLIVLFLDKALRDESKNPIRPLSVPSGLPLPIDPAGPG